MNKLYKPFRAIFFIFFIFSFSGNLKLSYSQSNPSQWPTFTMTAINLQSHPAGPPGPNQQDSILTFEVYIQQTNYGQPGIDPFEFCCAQYNWYFDKTIFQNPSIGNLTLTNLGGQTDLPLALRPPTFQVDSTGNWGPNIGLLKTSGNLPNSNINFFISGSYPGTKALEMKLTTNGRRFNSIYNYTLTWKLGSAPNTFLAYFVPNPPGPDSANPQYAQSLLDTVVNQYIPLHYFSPVELASFESNVVKTMLNLDGQQFQKQTIKCLR